MAVLLRFSYSARCLRAAFRTATVSLQCRSAEFPRQISNDAATLSESDTDSVVINWKTKNAWSRFHYIWLRDCCLCPRCLHPSSQQRLLDTLTVPMDVKPTAVELREGNLCIQWQDGHTSEYPVKWLITNSYEHEGLQEMTSQCVKSEPVVWGKEITSDPPCVDHAAVMEDDKEVYSWLAKIDKYGFCFVSGVPPTSEGTRQVAERIGCVRNTFYGPLPIATSQSNPRDTAYTSLAIDAHTDGNYFTEAPGMEMFHVFHFEGTGGQSVLVDGLKLAEEISAHGPENFKILSSVPLSYHHTDSECRLSSTYVPFTLDPETGQVVEVHFNNADRMPISAQSLKLLKDSSSLGGHPVIKLYQAIQSFLCTMKSESLQYKFQLKPGKLLAFNNHRVLHARTAFTGQRTLCTCYVNKEDWRSKLTVLREKYEGKVHV